MNRDLLPGTLALAVPKSANRKIGEAATTYAAQGSCPSTCVFRDGGGCYAETGQIGKFVTAPLNRAAGDARALAVAVYEAYAIASMEPVPGRPLRLHTVGDCPTDVCAQIVALAAAVYMERGGGPVWTYTHAWRDVERASWGPVSVLASCETAEDVVAARERGYATAIVVEEFPSRGLYECAETGESIHESIHPLHSAILPCPAQTHDDVSCSSCRLCFDDAGIRARGYSIGFALHGTPLAVKAGRRALTDPGDPDRKKTSRELIPAYLEQASREGRVPTNRRIADDLGLSEGSVWEMRKRLAAEAAS